jgi:hypothetical protein
MQTIQKTLIASAVTGLISMGLGLGVAYAKPPKKDADPAKQQQRQAKRAEFKQACEQDVRDLCAGVVADKGGEDAKGKGHHGKRGKMLQCLVEHHDELSDACAAKVDEVQSHHAQRQQAKAACEPDVQRLCGDVAPGKGAIRRCMKDKKDQLSDACKASIKDAHHK